MAKPNVISKDDLIKFAKECLVENGIERFTLRAIAERAEVTQGTVYYHFRTKEHLLLAIVQDICDKAWEKLTQEKNGHILSQAIESAKSRCSYDSFFHKLYLTLVISSFNNEEMRSQLGKVVFEENKNLTNNLSIRWKESPIKGVSFETWGIFLNAIVDGLALQALVQRDFPVDKVYAELENLLKGLTGLLYKEEK